MSPHVLALRTRTSAHALVASSRRAARAPLAQRLGSSPRATTALQRPLAGEVERATVGAVTVELEATA